jgi:hypothetical protein
MHSAECEKISLSIALNLPINQHLQLPSKSERVSEECIARMKMKSPGPMMLQV